MSADRLPPFVQPLAHGIHVVDTGFYRPSYDAAYLMVEAGRAAFIDTGTNFGVPRLLAALAAVGLAPEAVDWLIVSHVHLDHAGGAGLLMQSLPCARLVVHERGARHMIDPSALFEGARAVYGDAEMARSYGALVAVAAERVLATQDGTTIELAGRRLEFLDTPGHARHHHAVWDERSRGFFTGDTFGISYCEFDVDGRPWLLPSTVPTQFEPEPLKHTVRRLLAFDPACAYLTHYGRVGDVARAGASLIGQIDALVRVGRACGDVPPGQRHAALRDGIARLYLDHLQAHGCAMPAAQALELLEMDVELNAQGLGVWLDRSR
jgi:glyoxylase-like metal-dependent hydrolase (beta-lactamase superfamily II)